MNVLLPEGVAERIDALVGNRRRAKFIREAAVAELERREAQAAGTVKPNPAVSPSG